MANQTVYFALGFSLPGCMCNSVTPYAVTTRREVCDAIRSHCNSETEARKAIAALSIRSLWPSLAKHGASVVFRELATSNGSEVLCFMGMTEAEYNSAADCED